MLSALQYRVQNNQNHPNIKALKGFNGVFEIVSDYQTDTYRTVYAIKLSNAIFILHAFQKKSKSGIKTPKQNVNLIKERLKKAQEIGLFSTLCDNFCLWNCEMLIGQDF